VKETGQEIKRARATGRTSKREFETLNWVEGGISQFLPFISFFSLISKSLWDPHSRVWFAQIEAFSQKTWFRARGFMNWAVQQKVKQCAPFKSEDFSQVMKVTSMNVIID